MWKSGEGAGVCKRDGKTNQSIQVRQDSKRSQERGWWYWLGRTVTAEGMQEEVSWRDRCLRPERWRFKLIFLVMRSEQLQGGVWLGYKKWSLLMRKSRNPGGKLLGGSWSWSWIYQDRWEGIGSSSRRCQDKAQLFTVCQHRGKNALFYVFFFLFFFFKFTMLI